MAIPKACTYTKHAEGEWTMRCQFPERKACTPYLNLGSQKGMPCQSFILPGLHTMFPLDEKEISLPTSFGTKASIESATIVDENCRGYTDIDVAITLEGTHFVLSLKPAAIAPGSKEHLPGRSMSIIIADIASYKEILVGAVDLDGDRHTDLILKLIDHSGEIIYRGITNGSQRETTCISRDLLPPAAPAPKQKEDKPI